MEEHAERLRSVKIHTDRRDLTRLKSAHLKSGHLFLLRYVSFNCFNLSEHAVVCSDISPSFLPSSGRFSVLMNVGKPSVILC